jgi:hypothetical protein
MASETRSGLASYFVGNRKKEKPAVGIELHRCHLNNRRRGPDRRFLRRRSLSAIVALQAGGLERDGTRPCDADCRAVPECRRRQSRMQAVRQRSQLSMEKHRLYANCEVLQWLFLAALWTNRAPIVSESNVMCIFWKSGVKASSHAF